MQAYRWIAVAVLVCAGPLAVPGRGGPPGRQRPNVLFIVSDDQGYGDFGFTGNAIVKTPVLDRLAAESAVFRNFVVAAACSPSRAAFYTGRNHLLTGVWGVPPRANLHRDEAIMPAYFKAAGYDTLYVGKGDMARLPGSTPWERGWDDAWTVSGYQHRDPTMPHRAGTETYSGWTADVMTDLLVDFIRRRRDRPWLATAAFVIPHLPFACDATYSAPFREQGLSPELAECYGSIAQMDACIGRLIEAVRDTGQDRDTIVVFTSDNGMSSKATAGREYSDEEWRVRNVAGLRGHKAWVWENGIRVPLVVRWPDRIPAGDRRQFGAAEDILPTLLDLAAVPSEGIPHLPLTGVSLRPALVDADAMFERPAVLRMAIAGAGSPRGRPGQRIDRRFEDHHLALRGARFKYHALPGGRGELYDIECDPRETTDIAAQHPAVVTSMAGECRRQWDEIMAGGRAFADPPP